MEVIVTEYAGSLGKSMTAPAVGLMLMRLDYLGLPRKSTERQDLVNNGSLHF